MDGAATGPVAFPIRQQVRVNLDHGRQRAAQIRRLTPSWAHGHLPGHIRLDAGTLGHALIAGITDDINRFALPLAVGLDLAFEVTSQGGRRVQRDVHQRTGLHQQPFAAQQVVDHTHEPRRQPVLLQRTARPALGRVRIHQVHQRGPRRHAIQLAQELSPAVRWVIKAWHGGACRRATNIVAIQLVSTRIGDGGLQTYPRKWQTSHAQAKEKADRSHGSRNGNGQADHGSTRTLRQEKPNTPSFFAAPKQPGKMGRQWT